MGKTRDLFKKIRDTKGKFQADGHNKGQKWYGPKKQKILRRSGKNTQNYTKKILVTQITRMV